MHDEFVAFHRLDPQTPFLLINERMRCIICGEKKGQCRPEPYGIEKRKTYPVAGSPEEGPQPARQQKSSDAFRSGGEASVTVARRPRAMIASWRSASTRSGRDIAGEMVARGRACDLTQFSGGHYVRERGGRPCQPRD